MKKLKDVYGDPIKCGFCHKEITESDEIEYSREHCEFYCCPDHATTKYYEYEGSIPLNFEEAQKNIDTSVFGYDV